MLSPVVAVGAIGCFLAQHAIVRALGPLVRAGAGKDNDYNYEEHPMPAACVALLLLAHSLYTFVALFTANVVRGAGVVIGVNWVVFVVVCWWFRRRSATATVQGSAEGNTLTEPLLPEDPAATGSTESSV